MITNWHVIVIDIAVILNLVCSWVPNKYTNWFVNYWSHKNPIVSGLMLASVNILIGEVICLLMSHLMK